MRVAGGVVRALAVRRASLAARAQLLWRGMRVAGGPRVPSRRGLRLDQAHVLAEAAGRALLTVGADLARVRGMRVAGGVVRALAVRRASLAARAQLLWRGMRVAGGPRVPSGWGLLGHFPHH